MTHAPLGQGTPRLGPTQTWGQCGGKVWLESLVRTSGGPEVRKSCVICGCRNEGYFFHGFRKAGPFISNIRAPNWPQLFCSREFSLTTLNYLGAPRNSGLPQSHPCATQHLQGMLVRSWQNFVKTNTLFSLWLAACVGIRTPHRDKPRFIRSDP